MCEWKKIINIIIMDVYKEDDMEVTDDQNHKCMYICMCV